MRPRTLSPSELPGRFRWPNPISSIGRGTTIAGRPLFPCRFRAAGSPDPSASTIGDQRSIIFGVVSKLTASDGAPLDNFGDAVALDDDVVIVGASRRAGLIGISAGGAYIFRFDGGMWTEEVTLLAPDASPAGRFGNSVAIRGSRAVIGAFENDEVDTNAGSAYVFQYERTGWSLETTINSNELAAGDGYGTSVGIAGDVVVAGAPSVDGDTTSNVGAVYVYEFQPFNPVSVQDAPLVSRVALYNAYPNPTPGQTTIAFELAEPARVVVDVYDVMGRQITRLDAETTRSGRSSLTWNGIVAHSTG